MHEAYTASANASEGTETVSQTDMSLKPGETISLKLTLNSAKASLQVSLCDYTLCMDIPDAQLCMSLSLRSSHSEMTCTLIAA